MHPTEIRKYNHYKITEVNHTKSYKRYNPFIITQNTRQVYYLPYSWKCNSNWRVVIKTKAKDRVEVEEVLDEAYQWDDPIPSRLVVDTDIPSNLLSTSRDIDVIDLSRQHSTIIIEDTEGEQEEEEFKDDIQSKSAEESPRVLD